MPPYRNTRLSKKQKQKKQAPKPKKKKPPKRKSYQKKVLEQIPETADDLDFDNLVNDVSANEILKPEDIVPQKQSYCIAL